jgi:hypothetical protein
MMKGRRKVREIEFRECLVEFLEMVRVEWEDMENGF